MTAAGTAKEQIQDEGAASAEGSDKQSEVQLRERLEKLESSNRQLQSERDKYRSEASKQTEMLEKLTTLAETQIQREPGESNKDHTDRVAELAEEMADALREDEGKGSRKILDVVAGYASQLDGELRKAIEDKNSTATKTLMAEIEALRDQIQEINPEYVPVKDRVVELAKELSLDPKKDRELLVKLVKREQKTLHPERPDMPGALGASSNVGKDQGPPELSKSLMEALKAKGATQEEINRIAKRRTNQ